MDFVGEKPAGSSSYRGNGFARGRSRIWNDRQRLACHEYVMEWRRFGGHGFVGGTGQFLLEGKGFSVWVEVAFLLGC